MSKQKNFLWQFLETDCASWIGAVPNTKLENTYIEVLKRGSWKIFIVYGIYFSAYTSMFFI